MLKSLEQKDPIFHHFMSFWEITLEQIQSRINRNIPTKNYYRPQDITISYWTVLQINNGECCNYLKQKVYLFNNYFLGKKTIISNSRQNIGKHPKYETSQI